MRQTKIDAPDWDLSSLEKVVRRIELNLLKITREQIAFEDLDNFLSENYNLAEESRLFEHTRTLFQQISGKDKRYRFKRRIKRSVVKASVDYYKDTPDIVFGKKEEERKKLFENFFGQIAFCLCARALLIYSKNGKVTPKEFLRMETKYNNYIFRKGKAVRIKPTPPMGEKEAAMKEMDLLIDFQRLLRGNRLYINNKNKFREWPEWRPTPKQNPKRVFARVSSYSKANRSYELSLKNIDKIPGEWEWTCTCQDFMRNYNRNVFVVCHHTAAVVWRLMDEGKINNPWM